MRADQQTADAFASSWNNLPSGSVYTREQVEDWFAPIGKAQIQGKGTGTLAQRVQLRLVGNVLGIENLATAPMQLQEVKQKR